MLRRKVTAPDGRKWTLGRRWLPRRTRLGRADIADVGPGLPDLDGDDLGIIGMIFLVIAGVIVAVVAVLLLFNVVVIAIELTILVLVALAGVIGRVVFRRPWIVFARSGDERLEWPVVGYFNSRRKLDELAGRLSLGGQLERAAGDGR